MSVSTFLVLGDAQSNFFVLLYQTVVQHLSCLQIGCYLVVVLELVAVVLFAALAWFKEPWC